MKILFVAHWDWVLYHYRLPVARALRAAGVEVVQVCPRGDYTRKLQQEGFAWREWRLDRRSLHPFKEIRALAQLIGIYRADKPAAVHHFTVKPNLYGSIAAIFAGVPRIINTFSGLGFAFSADRRAVLLRILVRPIGALLKHSSRVCTVVQKDQDRQRLVEVGWADRDRSRVIVSSGVDLKRYRPSQESERMEQGHPIALIASRLVWEKGIGEFVEAARILRNRGVGGRFWIAGVRDPGNPSAVPEQTLDQWEQEGIVRFLGHRSDMPELLREVAIAVLPTGYNEGVPRFLLEAGASGLPLVASDTVACRYVVEDEVNGLLVPPRDPDALATALERLFGAPHLRDRFGRASREIVEARFGLDRIVSEYMQLYKDLDVIPEH